MGYHSWAGKPGRGGWDDVGTAHRYLRLYVRHCPQYGDHGRSSRFIHDWETISVDMGNGGAREPEWERIAKIWCVYNFPHTVQTPLRPSPLYIVPTLIVPILIVPLCVAHHITLGATQFSSIVLLPINA